MQYYCISRLERYMGGSISSSASLLMQLTLCLVAFICATDSSSMPVFQMFYERNPARCKYDRRLEVSTSPLNIICNPLAMKKVSEFFYKGKVHTSGQSQNIQSCFISCLRFTLHADGKIHCHRRILHVVYVYSYFIIEMVPFYPVYLSSN